MILKNHPQLLNDTNLMEYLYFLSGPLLLLSGLPQMIKLLKTKSSKDISTVTYACTWLAVLLLLLNSLSNGNTSLALANGVSMTTLTVNLFLIIKYKSYVKDGRILQPDASGQDM